MEQAPSPSPRTWLHHLGKHIAQSRAAKTPESEAITLLSDICESIAQIPVVSIEEIQALLRVVVNAALAASDEEAMIEAREAANALGQFFRMVIVTNGKLDQYLTFDKLLNEAYKDFKLQEE